VRYDTTHPYYVSPEEMGRWEIDRLAGIERWHASFERQREVAVHRAYKPSMDELWSTIRCMIGDNDELVALLAEAREALEFERLLLADVLREFRQWRDYEGRMAA
jgi:hypothetical protein